MEKPTPKRMAIDNWRYVTCPEAFRKNENPGVKNRSGRIIRTPLPLVGLYNRTDSTN